MDPVVGSVDMIGSNSNSAGGLINLCSLCNLQFSDNGESVDNDDHVQQAKVEKILDIFLSDDDEHGHVHLCLNCKMLCTNLICTKQTLLFIVDKITTLLVQNSRFTLVNPKYKIIPKLFQFRFSKPSLASCSSSTAAQSQAQIRTSFASTDLLCDNNNSASLEPEAVLTPMSPMEPNLRNQPSPSLSFANSYASTSEAADAAPCTSMKQIGVHSTGADCTTPPDISPISVLSNAMMYQASDGKSDNGLTTSPSDFSIPTIEASLNTPPFSSSNDLSAANTENEKHDDLLLTDLDSFNFPMQTYPLINENENTPTVSICLTMSKKAGLSHDSPMYICEVCGRSYLHKKRLEAHVERHKLKNRFQCSICHKTFTQKCGLERHLPVHTGELPFQCHVCEKRFRHHSSLNIHSLTHNGKRQFQCHSCDSSFMSTSHLRRHQKSHSGFKPFSCRICSRTFSEKYNLDSHVRTHTGETAYQCSNCALGFNRKKTLKQHLTLEHAVEEQT